MVRVDAVEPRSGYRIWVRFSDGTEGEIDLADLAGRGVFEIWADRNEFEAVNLGPGGSVAWPGEVELCSDSLYLRLTGAAPPGFAAVPADKPVHA